MRRGWTDADVAKVAGENVLRVMAACERVAAKLRVAAAALGGDFEAPAPTPLKASTAPRHSSFPRAAT